MDDTVPVKIDAPIPGVGGPRPAAVAEAPPAPRGVYIRRGVELEKFGPMENCPGCRAYVQGLKAVPHSALCRARISEAMRADVNLAGRVVAAEQRAVQRRMDHDGCVGRERCSRREEREREIWKESTCLESSSGYNLMCRNRTTILRVVGMSRDSGTTQGFVLQGT
eukprot:6461214-Amphidinium_carterae.2